MTHDPLARNDVFMAALSWAKHGHLVFPVGNNKRPHPCLGARGGFHHATDDPAQLRSWWEANPGAALGLRTGAVSGLTVVDIDLDQDKGVDGRESWERMLDDHGVSPLDADTAYQTTPRGGRHLFFRHTPDLRTGTESWGPAYPGLDVRNDGGYVVLAPSTGYEMVVLPDEDLVDVPPALLRAYCVAHEDPRKHRCEPPAQRSEYPGGEPTRYASVAMEAECRRVAEAGEGRRNDTLNRAAFALGQLVAGGALPEAMVTDRLLASTTLPEDEAAKTIRSGLDAGAARPRTPPARRSAPKNKSWQLDDAGNADRVDSAYGDLIKFTAAQGWMFWTSKIWRMDDTLAVQRRVADRLRIIHTETARNEDHAAAIAKWCTKSNMSRSLTGCMTYLQHLKMDHHSRFDANPFLLNVQNGILDLRDLTIRPHTQQARMTRITRAQWTSDAKCPMWDAMLARILPDGEVRDYFRLWLGYSMTGVTTEQLWTFLLGGGNNGKSTAIETAAYVMGSYAQTAPFETFCAAPANAGGARPDLARLDGARMVRASEPRQGVTFDEGVLKALTGGESIATRRLYRDEFEFVPRCKLTFLGNHRPNIRADDEGTWRRIRIVPFTERITEAERDRDMPTRLIQHEAAGILTWLARAAHEYLSHSRLPEPDAVMAATRDYCNAEDWFSPFIEDCTESADGALPTSSLIKAYASWCRDQGQRPRPRKQVLERLDRMGHTGTDGWVSGMAWTDEGRRVAGVRDEYQQPWA